VIEFIFTIDYEIYGNGEGDLKDLVYEPAARLRDIFERWDARFVTFVEVLELEAIEANRSDPAIEPVKRQLRELHTNGFEMGLHLHPQWCNAHYENGAWKPDYNEYNLCTLPPTRISQIIDQSIAHLGAILGEPDFIPCSFRAGNWLFQPTSIVATVLAERGIKVDSSVFKGGVQHRHNLDYRRSLRNEYYWRFSEDVNIPEPRGILLELPIYTKMAPIWKLLTAKRVGVQRKSPMAFPADRRPISRIRDFLRVRHPLKLDFCRMTMDEMRAFLEGEAGRDKRRPDLYRPIVAIGHTKDLVDFQTVEGLLSFLRSKGIKVTQFAEVDRRIEMIEGERG
jgi:hypothetical protein